MEIPNVDFVIVYNDHDDQHLVPMSATDPAGINVHLLFVSHTSGMCKYLILFSIISASSA